MKTLYAGLDVSLEATSICVADADGALFTAAHVMITRSRQWTAIKA